MELINETKKLIVTINETKQPRNPRELKTYTTLILWDQNKKENKITKQNSQLILTKDLYVIKYFKKEKNLLIKSKAIDSYGVIFANIKEYKEKLLNPIKGKKLENLIKTQIDKELKNYNKYINNEIYDITLMDKDKKIIAQETNVIQDINNVEEAYIISSFYLNHFLGEKKEWKER